MLSFLPSWLKGIIAVTLLSLNTLLLVPALMVVSLFRFLLPITSWQHDCTRFAIRIAELWMTLNSGWMRLTQKLDWHVEGVDQLDMQHWYLVTSNHQSWADIFILQHLLNRKIPMMKFFLKQQLIWVPVIGLAWWALDFPFMKRYSKQYLEKHPDKRGTDLKSTRHACEKFKHAPVTIFNFLEGTRFTAEKHQNQNSPYRHLLKPRAGGLAFVLGAMDSKLNCLVDITIAYPDKHQPSTWDFLSGQVDHAIIQIAQREIPQAFFNKNYAEDDDFRFAFQKWISNLWEEKDRRLEHLYQSCDGHRKTPRS